MRVLAALVVAAAAFAADRAAAQGAAAVPAGDPSGVTVDLGALPVPTPRAKPSPEEMRALLVPTPRPKPSPEEVAAMFPWPRPKPVVEMAAASLSALPVQPAVQKKPVEEHPDPGLTSPQTAAAAFSNIEPPPVTAVDPTAGFAVLARVRFANGGAELPPAAKAALDTLAERLLTNQDRVRLAAFSGRAGDMSSNARRLSLARALAVRTYLTAKGVPATRIDVLAYGGSTDGLSDRVDVLVRAI